MTEEKSMVDALIQNPFGEDVVKNTTLQDVASDFPQEQVDAKRALVDTLPEKQQEQARALAKQIDEKNMQAIISYGAGAQKQLGEFSHSMLAHVQNKDTGEIGDTLITTTIPLWKNQIAIAMTLLRQKDAVTAQRQVSETTNQLIQKNSEMLKISTIETARENERGIIDLETLQKTQQDLIETLEETILIQQEGRQKRRKAEYELTQMEQELRENLLVLSQKEKRVKEEMRG